VRDNVKSRPTPTTIQKEVEAQEEAFRKLEGKARMTISTPFKIFGKVPEEPEDLARFLRRVADTIASVARKAPKKEQYQCSLRLMVREAIPIGVKSAKLCKDLPDSRNTNKLFKASDALRNQLDIALDILSQPIGIEPGKESAAQDEKAQDKESRTPLKQNNFFSLECTSEAAVKIKKEDCEPALGMEVTSQEKIAAEAGSDIGDKPVKIESVLEEPRDFARSQRGGKIPTLCQEPPAQKGEMTSKNNQQLSSKGFVNQQQRVYFCLLCKKKGHSLSCCRGFKRMKPDDRFRFCQERHLHFRCLRRHPPGKCGVPICQQKCPKDPGCQFRHHELLHDAKPRSQRLLEEASKKKETFPPPGSFCLQKVLQVYLRPCSSVGWPAKKILAIVDHRQGPATICKKAAANLQEKKEPFITLSTTEPEICMNFEISSDGKEWFTVEEAEIADEFQYKGPEFLWTEFKNKNPKFQRVELDLDHSSLNSIELVLGSQVQDLWMPTKRRKEWICANRAVAYQTKLGWAIGGSLLLTKEVGPHGLQDQCLPGKTKAPSSPKHRAKLVHPAKVKKEDPARVSKKLQLPQLAKEELENWMKCHFQSPDHVQTENEEAKVFQQVVFKFAEDLDRMGFQLKSSSPRENLQAPSNPKPVPSSPRRVPAVARRKISTQVTRKPSIPLRGEQVPKEPGNGTAVKTIPHLRRDKLPPCTVVLHRRTGERGRQACLTIRRSRVIYQVETLHLETGLYSREALSPRFPSFALHESL
jgi:hypothetical protein